MAAVDSCTVSVLCSGPGGFPLESKTKYNVAALTAGNIAAQQTAVATLATRTQDLTYGTVSRTSIAVEAFISSAYPTNAANRGYKWVLTASNPSGRLFTYTIPAVDPIGSGSVPNLAADGVSADFASTGWTNFKGAFEAVAVDPNGAALTLLRAKAAGRRA